MTDGCLAVDIGGTKLAVALVTYDGVIHWRASRATPSHNVFAELAELCTTALEHASTNDMVLTGVGVGCGGPMNRPAGTVSPLHIPEWRNFHLAGQLESLIRLPVVVDNDAKALVMSEVVAMSQQPTNGHAEPSHSTRTGGVMAIVLGTGVGAGLHVDGRLLHGATGNAGHIGHVVVDPDGAECECGSRGCLEALVSGPAIERRTGTSATDVSDAERRMCGVWVGRAIASTCATLDINTVVLGGSVGLGLGEMFLGGIDTALDTHHGAALLQRPIVQLVTFGVDAPLIGAAALVLPRSAQSIGN